MIDNGDEVWDLFNEKFGDKMKEEYRRWVDVMMNHNSSSDERAAARNLLRKALGVDPQFEIDWERSVLSNPMLDDPDVRTENRRLLFKAWFSKSEDTEERNSARATFAERLGFSPFADDGPLHDWES